MLKQASLTLEHAMQLCQIDELTDERLKEMTAKAEIDELKQEQMQKMWTTSWIWEMPSIWFNMQ